MFDVIEKYLPCVRCFADDSQLYVSFKPDGTFQSRCNIWSRERCIADIRKWMINDRLPLNNDKTEVSLIGTKYQLKKLDRSSCLHVGGNEIRSVACARNLGVWFDEILCPSHTSPRHAAVRFWTSSVITSEELRNIYLWTVCVQLYMPVLLRDLIDDCNSLIYGLPNVQFSKLQRVQNAAARLTALDTPKFSHTTPALYELHWLPIACRICKILILTFKSIHACSNNSLLLEVPQKITWPTLGARSSS